MRFNTLNKILYQNSKKIKIEKLKRFMISLNFLLNGGVYFRCVLNKYFPFLSLSLSLLTISNKKGEKHFSYFISLSALFDQNM